MQFEPGCCGGSYAEGAGAGKEGIEQGLQQGRIHALIELVNDRVLTIEKAAEKADMSVEEFRNEMKNANAQSRE